MDFEGLCKIFPYCWCYLLNYNILFLSAKTSGLRASSTVPLSIAKTLEQRPEIADLDWDLDKTL